MAVEVEIPNYNAESAIAESQITRVAYESYWCCRLYVGGGTK